MAVDRGLLAEIADLKRLLGSNENGAGLAATQIGVARRFFGLKNRDNQEVRIFINPKVEKTYGERVYPWIVKEGGKKEQFLEGCLSFPDYYGTIRRYLKIDASWQEIDGEKLVSKSGTLGGLEAIVFQHEADHLDGVLFVDHIRRDRGKFYKWVGEEKIEWKVEEVI